MAVMDDEIAKTSKIPLDEIDLHIEETEDVYFIARALHRPTMTIKISDWWPTRDEAIKQVLYDLEELLADRLAGLGKR